MVGVAPSPIRKLAVSRFDFWLALSAGLLLVVGLMSLYSIDQGAGGAKHFGKQLLRLGIGVVPFSLCFWIRPSVLMRFANWLYAANVACLVLVLLVGSKGGGAQRWLNLGPIDFQPSEMSKVLTVITLAAFYGNRKDEVNRLRTFLLSIVHIAVPLALIFKQPHFGASLVILMAWLGVSIAAGLKARYLVGSVAVAAALLGLAFTIPGVLKAYQLERVYALLGAGTEKDKRFQISRAEMAIAAGGVTGAGYLKGEFKLPGFVPEQHTDFIFTVVGEEGGLFGCSLVLAGFGFFLFRIWKVMHEADEPFNRMVAAGIFSVLAFHAIVNLGMNLELLPVVGLWLPFMSYGGTAIWLCLASVGLLLNLGRRARPILF